MSASLSETPDDIDNEFLKAFRKYVSEYRKNKVDVPARLIFTIENVPLPYLLHSSAVKRLQKHGPTVYVLKPPDYNTPILLNATNAAEFETKDLKYALLKPTNKHVIKLSHEFVEWLADLTTELTAYTRALSPVKLDKLEDDVLWEIAKRLPNREYTRIRTTSRFLHNLLPKTNLHRYDVRNYFTSDFSQFEDYNLREDIKQYFGDVECVRDYQENEAKVLYLKADFWNKMQAYENEHIDIQKSRVQKLRKDLLLNSNAEPGDIVLLGGVGENLGDNKDFIGFYIMTKKRRYITDELPDNYVISSEEGPVGLIAFAEKQHKHISYENALKLLVVYWEQMNSGEAASPLEAYYSEDIDGFKSDLGIE